MHKRRFAQLLLLSICLLPLPGCSNKASDEVDRGTFNGLVYANKYFGLTLTIPSGWSIEDEETGQKLRKAGREIAAGDNQNLKDAFKANETTSVQLFSTSQHPFGAPVPFNPCLICSAQRVRGDARIKTGKDYLSHSRRLMEQSALSISFPKEMTTQVFSGVIFDVMHLTMSIYGRTIKQRHYAAVMKGYALLFITAYSSAEDEAALQAVLDSISLRSSSN